MDNDFLKFFNDELTDSQRLDFIRKVDGDPLLKREFAAYKNIDGLVSLLEKPHDLAAGNVRYRHFIKERQNRSRLRFARRAVSYAAALLVVAGAAWYITQQRYEALLSGRLTSIEVPAGQRTDVVLSDGTKVALNAGSQLIYPAAFGHRSRNVEVSGEAFFEVTRDERRPFVVSTDKMDVTVLGTQFNIDDYHYNDYASVSVVEGSVEVAGKEPTTGRMILGDRSTAIVRDCRIEKGYLHGYDNFLWRKGILAFEKTPFSEVIETLRRYYDVRIEVRKPSLLEFRYTGKFYQKDGVIEILNVIRKIQPFEVTKNDSGEIFID